MMMLYYPVSNDHNHFIKFVMIMQEQWWQKRKPASNCWVIQIHQCQNSKMDNIWSRNPFVLHPKLDQNIHHITTILAQLHEPAAGTAFVRHGRDASAVAERCWGFFGAMGCWLWGNGGWALGTVVGVSGNLSLRFSAIELWGHVVGKTLAILAAEQAFPKWETGKAFPSAVPLGGLKLNSCQYPDKHQPTIV